MRALRGVGGALGVVLAAYGAWLLVNRQDLDRLLGVATWLAAGVVVHDLLLAPLVVVVVLAGRLLPPPVRGPAAVGLVVLGSTTLVAVPVLGRFGARADNPTLLDRDYGLAWLAVAGVTILAVCAAAWIMGSRNGGARGPGARGRRRRDGA